MQRIETVSELQCVLKKNKKKGKTIGFVPTLGALHEGHLSLIHQSIAICDVTVCSIFVNPTQFDDKKDLEKYPRTIEQDVEMLNKNGCDILFIPTVDEIYPQGPEPVDTYELGELENILEGATRPGHYQGVAQVVERLLLIVEPDTLFLGQKDYQQVKILTKLIADKKLPVSVNMCEIIREEDGLAMSSRNRRLTKEERKVANELYLTLLSCKKQAKKISLKKLNAWAIANLNANPLITVDYIEFRNADTFQKITHFSEAKHVVLLGAIRLGAIRLIDNVIIY